MVERIDCAVIGAGVVGLACARALARTGLEVIVLESEGIVGSGTSSRNSEVIHAGIYYAKDSAKARLCVKGRRMLYDYCESHGVPYRRLGKLIVATEPSHLGLLQGIKARAAINGVSDLYEIGADDVKALEPNVTALAALVSPSTGIVDSHALMLAYRGDAETAGAVIAFNSPVVDGEITGNGIRIAVGGDAPMTLVCGRLVNAAGLHAQPLARSIRGLDPATVPDLYFARGVYFTLAGGKPPFSRLIYPVPDPAGGLGVHVTVDMGAQVKFGPDVEWIDGIDYTVDPARAEAFYAAIRRYWPDLADGMLQPGYAGIRPKLKPQGAGETDFLIQGPADHGVKGLVNLYGIESPGLTSSLAIAEDVANLLAP